jgi:hypothetical protein
VKISFSPIQELVIHEALCVQIDDLMRERITPAGSMPIYWCDGIGFSFSSLPMSDDIIADYMKGKLHWAEIHYAKMNSYTPVIELNDPNFQTSLKIRVIDTSSSALHRELVSWLKTHRQEQPTATIIKAKK